MSRRNSQGSPGQPGRLRDVYHHGLVLVDTFCSVPEAQIESAVQQVFGFTPGGIITTLDLLKPIYRNTAAYGHFGRSEFSWERTDKVRELQGAVG